MPILMGTKGNDILKWRASAELVASLKGSLALKWSRSSAAEAESFLGQFIGSLKNELDYEAQFLREVSALDEAIASATSLGELQPLKSRYKELASAHFRRRQSVLALCETCNRLHDVQLSKALLLAEERMLHMDQGGAPLYALLVSGDRGRREETLFSENRYFLLREEQSPRFFLFSRQVSAALKDAGLLSGEQTLWHGSLGEWRDLLGTSLPRGDSGEQPSSLAPLPPFAAPLKPGPQEMPEWEWRLEAITDLRFIQGDGSLAAQALDEAERTVLEGRNRAPFQLLARRVIALPLALGRFGRWRVQRSGERRGEINLEELALGPLVMTVRVLAVHAGIHGGGTLDRIQALLEKGALDVDLAGRLLKAYQCFMQLKILSEIRSEERGSYCNPEEFDEAWDARFRSALEAVLNLQKITYQKMVGQG
jgi:CBS domain-containing protein